MAKANKMWSFIWRNTKEFKNWKSIRVLYFSLVRSVLLYGSSICRPVCKNKIKMLEKVQHRAIRHLSYLSDQPMHIFSHDYSTLGKKFMIPTVASVLRSNDAIYVYKIMSGCVDSAELFNLLKKKVNNLLAKIGNDLIAKNYLLVNFDIEILSAIKLIKKKFSIYE